MRRMEFVLVVALPLAGIALAGCNKPQAASSPSFTSSIATPAAPASGQPQVVNNADTRVLQVAWTSARADKCQFYYDLPKLKASYLASESQGGATETEMARIEKAFEFTRASVAGRLATKSTYCQAEANIKAIKGDLNRYLTGDFAARAVALQTAAAE